MAVVQMLGLPLILDKITEGKGNCFLIAILEQCNRPEIICKLTASTKKMVKKKRNEGQMLLRLSVKNYIHNSDHPNITKFRRNYEENIAMVNHETWDKYWQRIIQNKVWKYGSSTER